MSRKGKVKASRNARIKKDVNKFENPETLSLLDVQCTVCVGIFIEPVTLPCSHSVCKVCFERTIDNNTLACPLCRKYVGGWVRQNQKKGLLVNKNLWSHINARFRTHVEKKLLGEVDEAIEELNHTPSPRVSEPGSIRLEYEAEQKRLMEEFSARQQQEVRANEELIKEIQQQEEIERKKLEELRKKAEEEDALIAKQIAAQLAAEEAQKQTPDKDCINQAQVLSAFVPLSPQPQPGTSNRSHTKGPMDAFLNQNLMRVQRTGSSSSTDSFGNELHHFRPLDVAPKTPPKKTTVGTVDQDTFIRKPIPVMRSLDGWSSGGASTLRPWIQVKGNEAPAIGFEGDTSGFASDVASKSAAARYMPGEKRPSENELVKFPKKFRSQSNQNIVSCTSTSTADFEADVISSSVSRKPSNCKRSLLLDSESSSLDLNNVECDSYGSPKRKGSTYMKSALTHADKEVSKADTVKFQTFDDIHSALIPLSLDELSEQAQAEQRIHQEQADYEFALKLQNELNAFENQNRSYELRSFVSLSPKKSQSKVTPPRSKVKSNPATSSSKKGRGRQCTLEETLNFSVKMKL